jgi:beta-barrel assembly-enhancing protease
MNRWLSRRYRRFWIAVVAIALTLFLGQAPAGWAQSLWQRLLIQGVQVIQLSTISPKQEIAIGQQINRQLLNQGMRIYADPQIADYVEQIGLRLVSVSDRSQIPYRFQVVRDRGINAFATLGGFVYVTTGLIQAADNEAQLASVLGHEIGHIEGRHLIQRLRQTALARGLISAAGIDSSTLVSLGTELAISRPLSRKDEFEADQRGLKMITKADYAEVAMPEFMKKLMRQQSLPSFMSTHPAVPDRVAALEKSIRNSPGNACTQSPELPECGLDERDFRQSVGNRLAG